VQFTLSGNNVNSTSFFIKGLNLAVKSALETSLKLNHYSKITDVSATDYSIFASSKFTVNTIVSGVTVHFIVETVIDIHVS
jgi:hypothetical protein